MLLAKGVCCSKALKTFKCGSPDWQPWRHALREATMLHALSCCSSVSDLRVHFSPELALDQLQFVLLQQRLQGNHVNVLERAGSWGPIMRKLSLKNILGILCRSEQFKAYYAGTAIKGAFPSREFYYLNQIPDIKRITVGLVEFVDVGST